MVYNSFMTNQTTKTKRTQTARTKFSKEKIIREAIRLFGQYGFRGATLAEIARAAGLTEPGLLHHFPSKEHLLMDVLGERDRVDQENLGVFRNKGTNVLDGFQTLVEHNETVPGLVQLFTVLAAESINPEYPGHEFFIRRYQTLKLQTTESLAQAQARGEIRTDIQPEELTVMIFALMDGLQVQWLLEPELVSMSKVFGLFVQVLNASSPADKN